MAIKKVTLGDIFSLVAAVDFVDFSFRYEGAWYGNAELEVLRKKLIKALRKDFGIRANTKVAPSKEIKEDSTSMNAYRDFRSWASTLGLCDYKE